MFIMIQLCSCFWIVFALDILKAGRRFHATVSFLTDTGLKEAQERGTDWPKTYLVAYTKY
jgi:hypothetical protein